MENTYAQALWRLLEDGKTPKEAVRKLHDSLAQHGRAGLLPKIARAFVRIAVSQEAKRTVTLTVARERDAHTAQKEVARYLEEMGATSKDVVVKEQKDIIGGWRLEGRERLVDASFKNHLLSLYNRVTS